MSTAALLLLAGFIPGLLLVDACTSGNRGIPWYEKSLYAAGAGYSLIVCGMLLLSIVSGPIARWHIVALYAGVYLVLIAAVCFRRRFLASAGRDCGLSWPTRFSLEKYRVDRLDRQAMVSVASVVLVGILVLFFRFAHLGYSEFQGDEATVALTAEDLIRGYENALYVRTKGPGEVLVPALTYRVTGTLTELQARLPFAVANSLAVMAVLLLGSRLVSPLAGLVAAVVVSLDGYLIAFGRILQYQSLVFLMVVLTVLVLYRLARRPSNLRGLLSLAAIFSATGALAHYEAVFLVVPGVYLLWLLGKQIGFVKLLRAAIVPLLLGVAILGLFYVPFVLKPTFENAFWYLFGYRVGGPPVAHALRNVFYRTTLYSTSYTLFLLVALAGGELARLYVRILPKRVWVLGAVAIFVFTMILLAKPEALGQISPRVWGAVLALLLSAAWISPQVPQEERLIWLWFGVTGIVALFLTARPNTHVYSVFIPWALLAGLAVQHGWRYFVDRYPLRKVTFAGATVAGILVAVFSLYAYQLFIYNASEVLRTWPDNRPRGYWTPYEVPVEVAIFGFPLRNGWNSIAAMVESGMLDGGFDTNARPAVAEWYTRGRGPCARDDPEYYFLTNAVEPSLADDRAELRRQLEEKFQLLATIEVNGEPHLEVFARQNESGQVRVIDDAVYSAGFHGYHVDDEFPRNGPIGPTEQELTADVAYRNGMRLRGFDVSQNEVRAGDVLDVALYWQATEPVTDDYRISLQVIDLDDLRKAGQREGEPGCGVYPTSSWLVGDLISDRYRVPIVEDAAQGDYTLLLTVYSEDGPAEILDEAGNPAGVSIPLDTLRVEN